MAYASLVLRELLQTAYTRIVADDDAHVIRRERTAARFPALEDLSAEYESIAHALDLVSREAYGALVDLRAAPPRNDDPFEAVAARYGPRLYGGFRKVAVVVQTAAGKLKVRRFLYVSRPDAVVFIDEREARAFLAGT